MLDALCTVQTGRVGKNKNVSDLELLSYFFFFSEIQQIFVKPLNKQFSSDSWQTNGDSLGTKMTWREAQAHHLSLEQWSQRELRVCSQTYLL